VYARSADQVCQEAPDGVRGGLRPGRPAMWVRDFSAPCPCIGTRGPDSERYSGCSIPGRSRPARLHGTNRSRMRDKPVAFAGVCDDSRSTTLGNATFTTKRAQPERARRNSRRVACASAGSTRIRVRASHDRATSARQARSRASRVTHVRASATNCGRDFYDASPTQRATRVRALSEPHFLPRATTSSLRHNINCV
jgi:hypothetical protein